MKAVFVSIWSAEARFGQAAALIRWLYDEELPRALALPDCVGAEGFAGDDDHRVMLVTRWSTYEAFEAWQVREHAQVWSEYAQTWMPLDEARERVR